MIAALIRSRRLAILLMLCFFALTTANIYINVTWFKTLVTWALPMVTFLLIVNILGCSWYRLFKNRQKHWGSALFHLGMVIILLGFYANAIGGFTASVVLQEGESLDFPLDIKLASKGILAGALDKYSVTLENYETEFEGNIPTRYKGKMSFESDSKVKIQDVEVNKPGRFEGSYWRFADWGYSVEIALIKTDEELYSGWAHLKTVDNYRFSNNMNLPNNEKWAIELFPNFEDNGQGSPQSINPQPLNPVVQITLPDKGGAASPVLIPIGKTVRVGDYTVWFVNYRYWQLFDISYDPGEILIYLGSIVMLIGLIKRTLILFDRTERAQDE